MGAKLPTEGKKLDVPAPGTYVIPGKVVESQGKSMGIKLSNETLAGKLGPGPGGYSYDKPRRNNVSFR
jgi:hypothetical protein